MKSRIFQIERKDSISESWTLVERGTLDYFQPIEESISEVYGKYIGKTDYRIFLYQSSVIGNFPDDFIDNQKRSLEDEIKLIEKTINALQQKKFDFKEVNKDDSTIIQCQNSNANIIQLINENTGDIDYYLHIDSTDLSLYKISDLRYFSENSSATDYNELNQFIPLFIAELNNQKSRCELHIESHKFHASIKDFPILNWHASESGDTIYVVEALKALNIKQFKLQKLTEPIKSAELHHDFEIKNIIQPISPFLTDDAEEPYPVHCWNDYVFYLESGEDRFLGLPISEYATGIYPSLDSPFSFEDFVGFFEMIEIPIGISKTLSTFLHDTTYHLPAGNFYGKEKQLKAARERQRENISTLNDFMQLLQEYQETFSSLWIDRPDILEQIIRLIYGSHSTFMVSDNIPNNNLDLSLMGIVKHRMNFNNNPWLTISQKNI